MSRTTSRIAIATMVAFTNLVAIGYAQTYTTFEVPNSEFTAPWAINPAGLIVGYYGSHDDHGFLREPDGTLVSFDVPGPTGTIPQAINPAGQVAGYYIDFAAGGVPHGFLREADGTFVTFDVPGSGFTGLTPLTRRARSRAIMPTALAIPTPSCGTLTARSIHSTSMAQLTRSPGP